MNQRLFDLGRTLIVAGCAYEILAIPHTTRIPTITACIRWSQKHWVGKLFVAVWLAAWAHHFIDINQFKQTKVD